MKVYIAGPYTKGDVAINVRNAIEAADRVLAGLLRTGSSRRSAFFRSSRPCWAMYQADWKMAVINVGVGAANIVLSTMAR